MPAKAGIQNPVTGECIWIPILKNGVFWHIYIIEGSGSFSFKAMKIAEWIISSVSVHCLDAFGLVTKEPNRFWVFSAAI